MVNYEEELSKVIAQAANWKKEVELIREGVVNLKKSHQQELVKNEEKLKNIRQKLFACQAEKDQIQKKFNEEIMRIQKSPVLDDVGKYQATKLVIEKSNDFVNVCEKLVPITNQYRQLRESYIEQIQISYDAKLKTITNLWITIWAMFILFFIFHCWFFWFVVPKWVKSIREKENK